MAAEDARVEHVTVYARGARVRRVTTVATPPRRIRITGLPLAVIDDTVRVELDGPALATNVRAGVDVSDREAAPEDTAELRGAKRRIAMAESELERIQSALTRLGATSIIADDPSDDRPAAWGTIVTARRSIVTVRTQRGLALHASLAETQRELEQAQRALAAARDRDRRAGTAKQAKQHELRRYVEIELVANGPPAPITIRLEYLVAAARWAPSYVTRLEGGAASVEVRAIVAQATGEDWTAVPLELSTAEPTRFAQLPELAAQRIGRRQHEPARAGFRAPPTGADALYADYERELTPLRRRVEHDLRDARHATTTVEPSPDAAAPRHAFDDRLAGKAGLAQEVWDEESSAPKEAFATPHAGSPMPAAAPMQQQQVYRGVAPEKSRSRRLSTELDGSPGAPQGNTTRAPAEPAAPTVLLDYANLVMAPPASATRGRLVPAEHGRYAVDSIVEVGRAQIAALPLPSGCVADWSHTYDYAFVTDGSVDVRADGAWHSIAVTAAPAEVVVHHVAVPREQADVFRVASIKNPLAGPLLPGPIDIYDQGRFLVTSGVEYTPPGGAVDVGLGVDAAVKIARNSEFREEATGMLRGALRLHHAVTIDIENVSSRAIELEVRERVPVTREGDDDIEVTIGKIDPAWERFTPDADAPRDRRLRGGHRWQIAIPAGGKRTLRVAYEVKISGKSELVGGNRRES